MSRVKTDAPATDAEVFQQYHYYVKYLIARYGFEQQFVEDMASIIFTKWVEKRVLDDYDPDFEWEAGGQKRTANFQTFLSGFVLQYLYHYKTREAKRANIEAFSTEFEISGNDGVPSRWLDSRPEGVVDDMQTTEMLELVLDIEKYLHGVKPTRKCTMEDFFSSVMRQVNRHGRVNMQTLAQEYGVTDTTIQNWLKQLRVYIKEARS